MEVKGKKKNESVGNNRSVSEVLKSQSVLTGSFIVTWTALSILALTWRVTYNWPDNKHIDLGLPFVWGTYTLSSIAGPVEKWSVDITSMSLDLALWISAMLVGVLILRRVVRN